MSGSDLATATTRGAGARTNIRAGIGWMVLAFMFFSLTNVAIKWLGERLPLPEVLFARSVTALVCLAPFLRRHEFAVLRRTGRPWLHLLRVAVSTAEVRCFFAAAALLPLADAVTLYLAGPIYVTALSALLLGEAVGWRRWTAVLVGFGGVLVAFAPSLAASLDAQAAGAGTLLGLAFAVGGSMLFAVVAITTRQLRAAPGTLLTALQVAGLMVGMVLLADARWHWPTLAEAALLAAAGVGTLLGYGAYNQSLRLAPASTVSPFQYTSLIWATLLGFVLLGEVPTPATLAGGAIIVGAGLFILWRERVRAAAVGS